MRQVSQRVRLIASIDVEFRMVFDNAEDVSTLKKIGLNVALLIGVMVALIVVSLVIG